MTGLKTFEIEFGQNPSKCSDFIKFFTFRKKDIFALDFTKLKF